MNTYQNKNYVKNNNNIDIIISRYQENIDWIKPLLKLPYINNIFIYNKFYSNKESPSFLNEDDRIKLTKLPNLGRESNTYLYHIIHNYNNLNEANVFLQGEPFVHCNNLNDIIQSLASTNLNSIIPFGQVQHENESSPSRKDKKHPHGLNMAYFMNLLFNIELDSNQTIQVNYGAQFCVSKQIIQHRPIGFYKYLYNLVSYTVNPLEGYILERLWLYIFNPQINISHYYSIWNHMHEVHIDLISFVESDNKIQNLIEKYPDIWSTIKEKILSFSNT